MRGTSCGKEGGAVVKKSPCNVGEADLGSIPGSRRSPGVENGNPLQYSCHGESHGQEEPGEQATVHGVKKSCACLHAHAHTHIAMLRRKKLFVALRNYIKE